MQTLHKTLHKPYISLIIQTLRNVGFMFQTLHKSYTRTYTNPTQTHSKTIHKRNANPTRKPTQTQRKTLHKSVQKLYTKPYKKHSSTIHPPTFWFWTRSLEGTFMGLHGEKRWRSSAEKTNNFERFFGDSTLTFLTFGNTFRLQILPTRRVVLLRSAPKWN